MDGTAAAVRRWRGLCRVLPFGCSFPLTCRVHCKRIPKHVCGFYFAHGVLFGKRHLNHESVRLISQAEDHAFDEFAAFLPLHKFRDLFLFPFFFALFFLLASVCFLFFVAYDLTYSPFVSFLRLPHTTFSLLSALFLLSITSPSLSLETRASDRTLLPTQTIAIPLPPVSSPLPLLLSVSVCTSLSLPPTP